MPVLDGLTSKREPCQEQRGHEIRRGVFRVRVGTENNLKVTELKFLSAKSGTR